MRGKVGYIHPFCHGVGITPAYAGKRSAGREFGTAAWDHPRACGEKAMSVTTMNKSQGSPPRMRGKETDSRRQCCSAGITPAYAGKRTLFCLAGRRNRDHPRVCGEKGRTGALDVVQRGSPPRMRGKVRELLFSFHCARITPAYAGKSAANTWITNKIKDHPRVCGEKCHATGIVAHELGSPPRMRGKGKYAVGEIPCNRITPAYAGKRTLLLGLLVRL